MKREKISSKLLKKTETLIKAIGNGEVKGLELIKSVEETLEDSCNNLFYDEDETIQHLAFNCRGNDEIFKNFPHSIEIILNSTSIDGDIEVGLMHGLGEFVEFRMYEGGGVFLSETQKTKICYEGIKETVKILKKELYEIK